ncbi:hypothetical protein Tco_1169144, partial [Tanacetum coccineum]
PPKRTSTSEASAMTHAAIRKLVADSVATALEAQAATMASTNNPNRNSRPRRTPVRILQKSKENGQNRIITNTGTELSVQKSKNAIKLRLNLNLLIRKLLKMCQEVVSRNPIKIPGSSVEKASKSSSAVCLQYVRLQAEEIKLEYSRNIVTNSRVTPSWREIISLTIL